jgi:hypothetical protein
VAKVLTLVGTVGCVVHLLALEMDVLCFVSGSDTVKTQGGRDCFRSAAVGGGFKIIIKRSDSAVDKMFIITSEAW